jgi:hypothetical protein
MSNVTCWLMTLSFVLGLLLTFALMVRRVKRQIPIYAALGAGAGVKAPRVSTPGAPTAKLPHLSGPDAPTMEMPLVSAPGAAGPYGVGSAKPGVGGSGPEGWTIKGNEDSMLYHTPDSPSYKQTIAEVWFNDEDVATKAGFMRWDKGRHPRS